MIYPTVYQLKYHLPVYDRGIVRNYQWNYLDFSESLQAYQDLRGHIISEGLRGASASLWMSTDNGRTWKLQFSYQMSSSMIESMEIDT